MFCTGASLITQSLRSPDALEPSEYQARHKHLLAPDPAKTGVDDHHKLGEVDTPTVDGAPTLQTVAGLLHRLNGYHNDKGKEALASRLDALRLDTSRPSHAEQRFATRRQLPVDCQY